MSPCHAKQCHEIVAKGKVRKKMMDNPPGKKKHIYFPLPPSGGGGISTPGTILVPLLKVELFWTRKGLALPIELFGQTLKP